MNNEVLIPSGQFLMGSPEGEGHPLDCESPQRNIFVNSFYMDRFPVTNRDFLKFINDTGYVTEAEREYGGSFVFNEFIDEEEDLLVSKIPWWSWVKGASWKNPYGRKSNIEHLLDHPVIHVSRNDAVAYCNWINKRLPTEVEWEYAARGGVTTRFPWGNSLEERGIHHANVFQGDFPYVNTKEDGYEATSPVKSYFPNHYGLYQMIGNVWEWCLNPSGILLNELSSHNAEYYMKRYWEISSGDFAIRGGSYLCHGSYCNRYRVSARNHNSANSTAGNLGFRCCRSLNTSEPNFQ